MKNYLLFDLDGTLTDPKEGICTCVQYALSSFGIDEPDLDRLEPFIGPPLKDSFMEFYQMDEVQAEAAIEKYRERFRDKGIFENELYTWVPEMLRALNSKGMFMAVASSKPTVFVQQILEHFNIAKYFKVVVGSELDGTRTDKAEVVEEAVRQLFGEKPVDKSKVYMIGDRRHDVEGAHAYGVEAVGVAYGYGSMDELKEARADYIVRSVGELQKFLLRGTEETEKLTTFQRIWQLALPFLLFVMVRNIGLNIGVVILATLGNSISGGDFLFIRNAEGALEQVTGNGSAIISTIGILAGAAAVFGIAKKTLARTANDMKLTHIKEEPGKSYLFMGIASVGLAVGLNALLELTGVINSSETYQTVAEKQYAVALPLGLICFGVTAPIAEELLFRGIIYSCVRRYMKPIAAMVMSAAFFAMYHGNSVQGIYAFAMGCLMVYAFEYFGDFRMPVAVHIISNVLIYSISYQPGTAAVFVNWPVCLVCLAFGVGGVWLLNREKKIYG